MGKSSIQNKQDNYSSNLIQRKLILISVVAGIFLVSFVVFLLFKGMKFNSDGDSANSKVIAIWIPVWIAVWIPIMVAKQKDAANGKTGKLAVLGIGIAVLLVLLMGIGFFLIISYGG